MKTLKQILDQNELLYTPYCKKQIIKDAKKWLQQKRQKEPCYITGNYNMFLDQLLEELEQ